MSVPPLVRHFYERIWEQGNLDAVSQLVAKDFVFRGSLGSEVRGRDAFLEYVRGIRAAVGDYRAEILACVTEELFAFAKMRFGGRHVGQLRGCAPTGKPVAWLAAALFRFEEGVIVELWVLGDLEGLDALLEANAKP